MKRKNNFLALLIATLMISTLMFAGCSQTAKPTASKSAKIIHITFVAPLVANPYWDTVEAGAKAAGKDLNVNVQYVGSTALDMNEWMKYIETAISEKVDGICTMALNEAAIKPLIDKAKAANIPVTLVDTDAPTSGRASYAGTDNTAAGKALGEALAKLTNGKANIGLVTGALDQPNLNLRIAGFKEGIKDFPNMKIVAFGGDNSDLQQCIQQGETMLKAHPEITTLVGVEGYGVPGLGRVVTESKNVGKITVAGFDDQPDTLAFLKDGTAQISIVQRQYKMGYMGVSLLKDIIDGKKVDSIVDTGTVVLTKDNVSTYVPASK
jgi:ribose transport system substrate-binding protein